MPNWLFFYWELKQNPILMNLIEENLISKIEYANLTNNYIYNTFNSPNILFLKGWGKNQFFLKGKQGWVHPIFLGLDISTVNIEQKTNIFLTNVYKFIQERRGPELMQYIINNREQVLNSVYVQHTHNIHIPQKNLNNNFISSYPHRLDSRGRLSGQLIWKLENLHRIDFFIDYRQMPNYSLTSLIRFLYEFNTYTAAINNINIFSIKLPYIGGNVLMQNGDIVEINRSLMIEQIEFFVEENQGYFSQYIF